MTTKTVAKARGASVWVVDGGMRCYCGQLVSTPHADCRALAEMDDDTEERLERDSGEFDFALGDHP